MKRPIRRFHVKIYVLTVYVRISPTSSKLGEDFRYEPKLHYSDLYTVLYCVTCQNTGCEHVNHVPLKCSLLGEAVGAETSRTRRR